MWGKGNPCGTVGENINWYSQYGKQYGAPSKKIKIELPNDPQSYFCIHSQGNEIRILKRYLYFYVHFSIIHNNQHIETTHIAIIWWTNKERVVYISQKILFSLKSVGNPVICNTMGGSGEHYAEWSQSDAERQVRHNLIYILNPN